MLGIFGLFLQAAAGHILYLALHLESGSFPRPLPPDRERAAFADLQKGGAAAAQARDTLIRHNLRLVAHICKKYYAGNSAQDDMISIGTIGLIKAVDTFDPAKGKRFASYASRCIENELRMDLRRGRRTGVTLSLQEPLEADGQLTLADTLPDEADMEAGCESRADAARLRALWWTLCLPGNALLCGSGMDLTVRPRPSSRRRRRCTSAAVMFRGWKSARSSTCAAGGRRNDRNGAKRMKSTKK